MKTQMFPKIFSITIFLVLTGLWIPRLALAEWPGDPNVNVPICTASWDQDYPQIASEATEESRMI